MGALKDHGVLITALSLVNAADKLNVRSDSGIQLVGIRDELSFGILFILSFILLIYTPFRPGQSRRMLQVCLEQSGP
jgi:hypothetical protein